MSVVEVLIDEGSILAVRFICIEGNTTGMDWVVFV